MFVDEEIVESTTPIVVNEDGSWEFDNGPITDECYGIVTNY